MRSWGRASRQRRCLPLAQALATRQRRQPRSCLTTPTRWQCGSARARRKQSGALGWQERFASGLLTVAAPLPRPIGTLCCRRLALPPLECPSHVPAPILHPAILAGRAGGEQAHATAPLIPASLFLPPPSVSAPRCCRLQAQLAMEEDKRARWAEENVRRRTDYIPFSFQVGRVQLS